MQIIIIMSTFNGEKYLKAQLDSLLEQTVTCSIFVRDDGSSDNTQHILSDYASRFVSIHWIRDTLGNLGTIRSYSLLLKHALNSNADYFLYCDQDDVWLPEKVEKLLRPAKPLEKDNKPILIFSDAQIVDKDLTVLASSLHRWQHHGQLNALNLKKLLIYCPAQACTMLLNRSLVNLLLETYVEIKLFPDKWALLLALLNGHVVYVPESTVLYRQHASNIFGALTGIQRKVWKFSNIHFLQVRYQTAADEAQQIKRFLPGLAAKDHHVISQFILLFTGTRLQRIVHYCKFALVPPHWKRKFGLFLSLFFDYNAVKIER